MSDEGYRGRQAAGSASRQERGGSENLADLMSRFMSGTLSKGLSDNQKAAAAWYAANGDIERSHTTGVYLRKPKVAGADPVLCVYVDSHARMMDFYVMREVYLLRLANVGFAVSGIEFRLSKRRPGDAVRTTSTQAAGQSEDGASNPSVAPKPLPELDAAGHARAEGLASQVPPELHDAVLRAVEWSMRREKSQDTPKP